MRASVSFVLQAVVLAPLLVSARPFGDLSELSRRAGSSSNGSSSTNGPSTDVFVLKFADVLERLEAAFYTEFMQVFNDSDYKDAGFASAQVPQQQLQRILSDESTHAAFLNSTIKALGGTPLPGCKFNFSSVLTDVGTAIAASRLIEITGAGAYLGSAHLLSDPSILTTAATIATVESRHQTILNALNNGTALPQAFDVPLLPQEVLSLAGGFFSGCNVGVTPLPALSAKSNTSTFAPGAALKLSSSAVKANNSGLSCQLLTPGAAVTIASPLANCTIPKNATGPLFIWVTNSSEPLSGDVITRGNDNTTSIVAGPDIIFIDYHPEALGSIIRGGNATV